MEKYDVEKFGHIIKDNGNGYDNLFINIRLRNSAGNVSDREYRISPDERFPDLKVLTALIIAGLAKAHQTRVKIGLSEYEERMYLFLSLPVPGAEHIQVSGARLK